MRGEVDPKAQCLVRVAGAAHSAITRCARSRRTPIRRWERLALRWMRVQHDGRPSIAPERLLKGSC